MVKLSSFNANQPHTGNTMEGIEVRKARVDGERVYDVYAHGLFMQRFGKRQAKTAYRYARNLGSKS